MTDHRPDRVAVSELTYEQARAELDEIVTLLERGRIPLADTLAAWERGEDLVRHATGFLDGAAARLEQRAPSGDRGAPAPF